MLAQFHHHMQILWCLEAILEFEYVGMVHLTHDLSLCDSVPDLIVVDQSLFLHRLHGIDLTSCFILHFKDSTE